MGPVIYPKMRNLFGQNLVIFKSVCFNNDCVITQHTPKCDTIVLIINDQYLFI